LTTCLSGRYRQNASSPTFTTEGPGNVMTLPKGACPHSILGNSSHNWSTVVQPHMNVIYMIHWSAGPSVQHCTTWTCSYCTGFPVNVQILKFTQNI